jgi:ParB/RepB/Spo0J family partition protein
MSKTRRTSAAIVGLLDAIKLEGIETVDDLSVMAPVFTSSVAKNMNVTLSNDNVNSSDSIPYQIKLLDTKQCKPWYLANRLREYLTPDSCADLIESLQKVGQQIPALVRRSKKGEGYELICGARRLFACEHLGIKIKAAVVDLSDKDALLAMDAENRPREDISPYERACDYKRWVDMNIYKNYTEIMHGIGVKKSWFSKLMALADLHEDIVKAFGHPANLKQLWGYELQVMCKQDKPLELAMIQAAKDLYGKSLSPAAVFNKLKHVHAGNKAAKDLVWVNDGKGKKLFKIRFSKSGRPQLTFSNELSKAAIDRIISSTKLILEENTI